MTSIAVSASEAYEVQIGSGLIGVLGEEAKRLVPKANTAVVISDSNVAPLYLASVEQTLTKEGFSVLSYVFPAGESSKNGETYLRVLEFLAEHHVTRNDLLLALGGGVVGDMTGFVAATYLRGVAYIQVPTTLLACVDSSVGGKTAIDLKAGKNLAGAFYQPRLVMCDLDTLDTLSSEVFADGMAEVIKYGFIDSASLISSLQQTHIKEQLETVIAKCVTMKRDIVERDEFETGDRKLLNLGHTIGHAIEKQSEYAISHGSAVAIGMVMMTKAAIKQGFCQSDCLQALNALLNKYHLPSSTSYLAQDLYEAALGDKKRAGNHIDIIVPVALGKSEIKRIDVEELKHWIEMGLEA